MNKIQAAFANGKAFIPFITCGDPDLETTEKVIHEAVKNGADLIELGIPFMDPTAEGSEILGANIRALAGGVTTDKIFDFVKKLREEIEIPLVFRTYANVVFSYGTEKFMAACKEIGIDAILLLDLPFEEKDEFEVFGKQYGVALILQIAPASKQRISMIAKEAEGFLIISGINVTRAKLEIAADISSIVSEIRENTDIPCAVDFDISAPDEMLEELSGADGVIAGTSIVEIIKQNGKNAAKPVGEYVKSMKEAIM